MDYTTPEFISAMVSIGLSLVAYLISWIFYKFSGKRLTNMHLVDGNELVDRIVRLEGIVLPPKGEIDVPSGVRLVVYDQTGKKSYIDASSLTFEKGDLNEEKSKE